MRTFLTSDLHFFHRNIIQYSNRPYLNENGDPDVDAMNEGIVANWNEVVGPKDRVYILGDVAMGGKSKAPKLAEYLRRLNGTKYLVPGNHDTYILNSEECMAELTLLPPLCELRVPHPVGDPKKKLTIVMCHYPLHTWNKAGRTIKDQDGNDIPSCVHFYGHSHTPKYELDSGTTRIDVGMDGHDCTPWSLDELWNVMKDKTYAVVDHHNSNTNHEG
jgi:calcineurin-like phosphoesterase family protein